VAKVEDKDLKTTGVRSYTESGDVVPAAGDSGRGPDVDARNIRITREKLRKQRKWTAGIGLLKGMGVTLKHLFKHNTVIEYPD
jgi:hypothetical protein